MRNKMIHLWVLVFLLTLLSLPVRADQTGLDTGPWKLYFGQLHAHTSDSYGKRSVEEVFSEAEAEGLDFFAVTDHSDSFENDEQGSLTGDGAQISKKWASGRAAAKAATGEDFVALYGFEMTWNQGQGHMSTFNTSGWLSRDHADYDNYKNGLENYYQALLTAPDSISQFNHPGTKYGDFKNFAWHSPEVDTLVTLIEVGSDTGSGYETAYDDYTRVLDNGWHLAPTNNQNNHNSGFAEGASHRTVVLASELTEKGIYDALRNYRVYATEDCDLQIYYTLNGYVMGSEVSADTLGDTAQLSVAIYDPTDSDWGKVEVITESGAVVSSAPASTLVTFSQPTDRAYYYIHITQPDGGTAVTAPIWLRQKDDVGISVLETKTPLTRAGETQTIALTVYNNEAELLTISSVKLRDQNGNLLGSLEPDRALNQFEIEAFVIPVCFDTDGIYTVTAEISGTFAGEARSLTRDLEIPVLPMSVTGDVLVDGTHGSNWDGEAFVSLAAAQNIAVHTETQMITAKQLEACQLLVIPAPQQPLSEEFAEQIKNYVNQGGNLLLLGSTENPEEVNRLLENLGSSMSMTAGGSEPIYTANICQSTWTEGIIEGQVYAHLGYSVNPGEGAWLVKHEDQVLLAAEKGIVLAGSDFLKPQWLEVSQNSWAVPYANRTIVENLLGITRTAPKVTPIGMVRNEELGRIYLAEGLVTAGTYNPNTTFPDTIYLQDATGGIAAVGYSEKGLELGRRVRILGSLETDGENPRLRILTIEILEKENPVIPEAVSVTMDYASQGGKLLMLEGTVISAEYAADAVLQFVIEDTTGNRGRVWIGEEISSGSLGRNELAKTIQVGNRVSAVGLCHGLQGETVLRVRDCDEVKLLWSPPEETLPEPTTEVTMEPTTKPTTKPTEKTSMATTEDASDPVVTNGNPPTGDMSYPGWAWGGIAVCLGVLIRCALLLL